MKILAKTCYSIPIIASVLFSRYIEENYRSPARHVCNGTFWPNHLASEFPSLEWLAYAGPLDRSSPGRASAGTPLCAMCLTLINY